MFRSQQWDRCLMLIDLSHRQKVGVDHGAVTCPLGKSQSYQTSVWDAVGPFDQQVQSDLFGQRDHEWNQTQ